MLRTYQILLSPYERIISLVEGVKLSPGVEVHFIRAPKSRGIIVGVTKTQITVLWTITPEAGVDITIFPPQAYNVTSIQPMSLPSGHIFYDEYINGNK